MKPKLTHKKLQQNRWHLKGRIVSCRQNLNNIASNFSNTLPEERALLTEIALSLDCIISRFNENSIILKDRLP